MGRNRVGRDMNDSLTKEYLAYTLERLLTDNKAEEAFYKVVAGVLRGKTTVDTIYLDYLYGGSYTQYRVNLIETNN